MIQCLLTAPASGSGKTSVVCALLRLLQRQGLDPCAFKCGPDYIDPLFHRAVLDAPSYNLDLVLSDDECVRRLYVQNVSAHGSALIEGVMGYYDGAGLETDRGSAWSVANCLGVPSLLICDPKGAALTLAAQIRGLVEFREQSHLAAIFLNRCSDSLAQRLRPMLESQTGLPVVGWLPTLPDATVESRHLGLVTAEELHDLQAKIDVLADALEARLDWEAFSRIYDRPAPLRSDETNRVSHSHEASPVIAVARDRAFCFTYPESLAALEASGASLVFFSPLNDAAVHGCADALYLPGGYPELYAAELAANTSMLASVRQLLSVGMPTVAECGGFLYLLQELQDADGASHPMVGALPGHATNQGRPVRFGYSYLEAPEDSLLFRAGERVPVHEFHYWDCSELGEDLCFKKPYSGITWKAGFVGPNLYAAFPHLYLAGTPALAERFVSAARHFKEARSS